MQNERGLCTVEKRVLFGERHLQEFFNLDVIKNARINSVLVQDATGVQMQNFISGSHVEWYSSSHLSSREIDEKNYVKVLVRIYFSTC
jgi:hypothetical protein